MGHLPGLIEDLALILIAAAITSLLFRWLKQPLVLGYIIAGFLIGPHLSLTPTIADTQNIETLAEIGVIFLLFSLGLEFSFKKLIHVGGSASITALVEIIFITIAGFYLGRWMGWGQMDSLFLGGMLASSSTTITIKAFEELKIKTRQYVRVVFGVLIVQDIVVVLLMVLLSTVAVSRHFQGSEMFFILVKLIFFLILWFIAGIFLLPSLLRWAKKLLDEETLLILSLGLCLGMVVVATQAGFSAELGAFIMGSILAETTKAEKIENLLNPVKDLFGAIFFVSVGMLIDPQSIVTYRWPVLWVTLLTLFGKLFSTVLGALLSGQPLKQSIQVGMSMAQIGEFTFIVATLGLTLGVTSNFLFPVAVGASAITIFTTPYMIKLSGPLYQFVEKILPAKWLRGLNNYSSNTQKIQAESRWKIVMMSYLNIIVSNGIILLALMLVTIKFFIPFLKNNIDNNLLRSLIALIVTLGVASPFLWAFMAKKPENTAYKELWLQKKYSRGPLLIFEISRVVAGVLLIGFWVDRLFTTSIAILVAVPLIIIILILFSNKIQHFYHRLEGRFLTNLNARQLEEKQKSQEEEDLKNQLRPHTDLSPWDAHMINLEVNPHAEYIGKTLVELSWREKYGINIAYIKRGDNLIYAPTRFNRLLPFDDVGIIATDDQMQKFQPIFEEAVTMELNEKRTEDIILQKMVVDENNRLKGLTIRGSGIRELTNGLVVGIERNEDRILNPDSGTKFEWGDIIWIVGEREKIKQLNVI
ncbi:MAG TPA: cation:proton antiporter [Hanamia sp.]|nr:cation:proton antiporter [Hanamia sp.]